MADFSPCLLVQQPFADPNAKKKYTQVAYSKHIATTARGLLTSTFFGIAMTTGLHFYKGMIVGLAIQAIMAPFNLIENALVKALLWDGGLKDGAFDEKTAAQLTNDDEVVDDAGNVIVVSRTAAIDTAKKSFEEVLLDTWDDGTKADLEPLLKLITKENCNYATKENNWTPLMILCGLSAKGTAAAIRQVKEIGGDPFQVDVEGWNALHWAAFHGSLEAAKALEEDLDKLALVKDKEGKTPLEHAKAEGNDAVAIFLEEDLSSAMKATNTDGMRKRK
jgi:hypothetical protein